MDERHAVSRQPQKNGFPQTRLMWENKKVEVKKKAGEIYLEAWNINV
ncbi:hypothetical protein RSJ42_00165 [Methanosarcina hadiensis]